MWEAIVGGVVAVVLFFAGIQYQKRQERRTERRQALLDLQLAVHLLSVEAIRTLQPQSAAAVRADSRAIQVTVRRIGDEELSKQVTGFLKHVAEMLAKDPATVVPEQLTGIGIGPGLIDQRITQLLENE